MTEREWQGQVLDLARMYRWMAYHTHDSRRSHPGFPDLVLVRSPRVIFAELKTDKGRTSAAQDEWITVLARCPGVETYLWRPADFDHVRAQLAW